MAAEHWFRWHHGTVNDPKWRVVASRCVTNVTVGHVVAVWAAMMENASLASPRGELDGWNDEDVAAGFGFTTEQVKAIREAMQSKVLDGDKLNAWEKRQPKREDSSTERSKAWRERNKGQSDAKSVDATQCNAMQRTVTLETETETETETEKKEQEQKQPPGKPVAIAKTDLPQWVDPDAWSGFAAMRRKERHPLTDRATSLIVKKLETLRDEGHDPAAILDQSTRNGWRDVFPIKADAAKAASKTPDYLVGAI